MLNDYSFEIIKQNKFLFLKSAKNRLVVTYYICVENNNKHLMDFRKDASYKSLKYFMINIYSYG